MVAMNWFDVDKEGLAKLLEGRSRAFVIYELVQNAWDTSAKQVEIRLEKFSGSPKAKLTVIDDDPEGFVKFEHAWTMYAESTKKGDPSKRGIFNEGEKMVLALCYSASIKTTKGTVTFDGKGRHHSKAKREFGSCFEGVVRMNQQEYDECCQAVARLIPPTKTKTYFNGELLKTRKCLTVFEAQLPTTIADETGTVRPTKRYTFINVYEPLEGEIPSIYEMGIPVVETGDLYHIDVQQRVPLNRDRDNVTPSYLRKLRAVTLNAVAPAMSKDDSAAGWVGQAIEDPDVSDGAVEKVMEDRFGKDRAVFDPSDPEANHRISGRGGFIIPPRAFSKEAWSNIRSGKHTFPAGQIAPTPKPFTPDGDPLKILDRDKWTPGMERVAELAEFIQRAAHKTELIVQYANDPGWRKFDAVCDGKTLTLNVRTLGSKRFDEISPFIISLIIHELAHTRESNHLADSFHEACCDIGAAAALLAIRCPYLFAR